MTTRLPCALVCLVGALAAHQLSYSSGQFSFEPERGFQRVVAKDFTHDGPPGYPELPVRTCTSTRLTVTPEQQYLPGQAVCMVIPRGGEGPQADQSGLPRELGFTTTSANPVLGDFAAQYGVPVSGRVRLTLHDVQGRTKMVVADQVMKPGYYRLAIKKQPLLLPAGIYYLTLDQQDNRVTKKIVLVY